MAFAEDLVREQEALLAQLHEKQRENTAMVTQFGSLKKKLKVSLGPRFFKFIYCTCHTSLKLFCFGSDVNVVCMI